MGSIAEVLGDKARGKDIGSLDSREVAAADEVRVGNVHYVLDVHLEEESLVALGIRRVVEYS